MLFYSALCSLDGYVEDADGGFDFAVPDADVAAYVNELEREAGTMLLGRRMYETLAPWETMDGEFGDIWRTTDKVVYSRTLTHVASARTRIERELDPDAVREMKAAGANVSIGGAGLAGAALSAGLVDELRLFLAPVVIGGGKSVMSSGLRLELELLDERRFANGVVYVRYGLAGG